MAGLTKPFAFVDIACGDAGQMKRALAGTKIDHYHGIDLSEPALELAAKNLENVPFEVELDQIDFVEALTKRAEPANAAWCGLSIHHLSTDGTSFACFEAIHRSTKDFLMIYEPTLAEGENRDGYLARFRRVNRPAWTFLSDDEWAQIDHHVHDLRFSRNRCDLARSRPAGGLLQSPVTLSRSDRLLQHLSLRPLKRRGAQMKSSVLKLPTKFFTKNPPIVPSP